MINAKKAREKSDKYNENKYSFDYWEIDALIRKACSVGETNIQYTFDRKRFSNLEKKLKRCGFKVSKGQEWNYQIDFVVSW